MTKQLQKPLEKHLKFCSTTSPPFSLWDAEVCQAFQILKLEIILHALSHSPNKFMQGNKGPVSK